MHAHLEEMAKACSPVYAKVRALTDPEAQREAGLLADILVSDQITAPVSLPDSAEILRAMHFSMESAKPDRKCMGYVLRAFPAWVDAVSSTARETFLDVIPKLAPAAADLGDEGMRLIIEAVNVEPKLIECTAAYAMTTGEAIRAVARIAHRAASHHRRDLLEKLVEIFPAGKMEESRDAEHLLPAMARATEAAASNAWVPAMELALKLTARDVSSARGTLESLPASLRKVPVAVVGPYLDDFHLLVEHIGIRVNGICLNELPAWYARHGTERTRAFVSCAAQAGRDYGTVAGQYFLERKTAAAKEMLS